MSNPTKKFLGVSNDGKYLFTNKGFYVCESDGFYIPYNEGMLPYLVQIAKDNNEFEFKSGSISILEYLSKPRKILTILSEALSPDKSIRLVKEWEENFGKKTLITESSDTESIKKAVNESFNGLRTLVSEQNDNATALDITNKLIDALSGTFDDDEQGALKQIKRITSKPILDKVNQLLKSRKNMDIKAYINDEMSDADWEYKSIYDHLKKIDAGLASGYKQNKFYQAVGKVTDTAAKGIELVGKGLSWAAQKIIIPIIKQGIIPLMRWIRRNLNTYLGIIVDVILSLLPTVVVMKIIWMLIVLLDVYEIATGDYDPDDPERKQMPFIYLMTDLISLIFTAAAGKTASVTLKAGIKKGATSPAAKSLLKSLLEKLPGLNKFLGDTQKFLVKLFGESVGGFIGKLVGYFDSAITKLTNWIKQVLGMTAKEVVTKKGATKLLIGTGMGIGVAELFADKSFGEGKSGIYGRGKEVKQAQENLIAMTQEGGKFNVGYTGPATGIYDKKTGNAVYKLYQALGMTPKREATPYIMNLLGVQLQPGGVFKVIPQKYLESFGTWVQKKNKQFADFAKKMGAKGV